ncbi:hypothetical protein G6F57_022417 [Rhizopus arrhizus]|nr:hypothetical protein G6F57_022417 [Rhizopus arrhizus]
MGAVRGHGHIVRADLGVFPDLAGLSPHAAAAGFCAGGLVHLVRRKHRHLRQRLALPEPVARLAMGVDRQAGLVVPLDDHQLCDGQHGQPAAGNRCCRSAATSRQGRRK